MEASKKGNNGAVKRKRIDARTFKQHITQSKKTKGLIAPTPENSNQKFQESCSKDKDTHCEKKQKIDSEVYSELGIGEEKSGVPEASSSTIVLSCEPKHGELLKDGALDCKKISEDPPHCKTKVTKHVEYWVPVGLSYVQLEKYCEILLKNRMLLCSNLHKGLLDSLQDILATIKKCCDHPYLVDSSLQKFVNDGRLNGDYLSNGIEGSGKLLVLDKLLQEVKEKQLRVVIVFQSSNSKPESLSLQHILDDLVCQKIGEERYVHIYREFDCNKKRGAVDVFNDKESRKLVMLIEKNSCQPSIKLSSIDCVILFNSDWSPINDMKPLRKMLIQSKFDHLKVFRLYSSKSVEEKALTLVKEGISLESSLNLYSYNSCHKLLLWDTSYLFGKLDELHRHCSSIADINCLSEDKLVFDVFTEFSALLSCQESDNISCSLISKVSEASSHYSQNIALHGEQDEPSRDDDDLPPSVIWYNLLEGRNPLWRFLPGSAEKIRRRGKLLAKVAQNSESNNQDGKSKNKTLHSKDGNLYPKSRVGKVCRPASNKCTCNIAGYPKSRGNAITETSFSDDCISPSLIEEICLQRMRELILKQKKEIREYYKTRREDRTKLEQEHQKEVDLINQRDLAILDNLHSKKVRKITHLHLKELDLIYEKKLEEHSRQLDTKRKKLEDKHLASRLKIKQLKDKLCTLLKTKNSQKLTTSLLKLSLQSASVQKTLDLIDNPSDSTIMITKTSVSERNHSQENELGVIDASVQFDDPQFILDHVLREEKNLSVDCREENHTESMLREVSDTAESGTRTTVVGQQRLKEMQDGDCNIKAPTRASDGEAEMRGDAKSGVIAAVNGLQRVEVHDGYCNIEIIAGESDGEIMLRGAADSDTTATVAAQQRIEEVLDRNCDTDALGREPNGEDDSRAAADSGTTSILALQERTKEEQDKDCNATSTDVINVESNGKAELRSATGSGATANVVAHQRIKEGQDGDCNNNAINGESYGKTELRGAPDLGTASSVASHQRIEVVQDGDCNSDTFVGEFNGEAELRVAADSSATVAGQQRIEELWDRDYSVEVCIGAFNGEAETRDAAGSTTNVAADSSMTATVAGQQRIEELWDRDYSVEVCIGASNGEAETRDAAGSTTNVAADSSMTATVAGQQIIEGVRDGDCIIEAGSGVSSGEAEMRGAAGTITTVLGQKRMEESMELASSRLDVSNQLLVRPQTCIRTGYSSPLQQPMASVNFPCFGALDVYNCQTRVHVPFELDQTQVRQGNFGYNDQPVVQTQLQSVGQEHPHTNSGMPVINQSVNSYIRESSSLRSNPHLSNSSNLFQNELIRIKKEVDECVKFHEDKTTHLKSACAKEIQAIQQKCDLWLREAENTLLQKKLELESHYRKVYANMVLADTVKYKNHKQITSPTSQEALLSEIFEISQLCLPMQSNVAVNNKPVPPPVQVVNRLSELVTFDANTPRNLSTLHNMGHHPGGYHARASAPHHYPQHRAVTCSSTSNMQTSFYGVTDHQTAVWPHGGSVSGWRQPGILPGSSPQLGGTPQNPLQFGGTPQNPLQL